MWVLALVAGRWRRCAAAHISTAPVRWKASAISGLRSTDMWLPESDSMVTPARQAAQAANLQAVVKDGDGHVAARQGVVAMHDGVE